MSRYFLLILLCASALCAQVSIAPQPVSVTTYITNVYDTTGSTAGMQRWGHKSITTSDSSNTFSAIYDSTRAVGRIQLGDGTWSTTGFTIDGSNPIYLEGTTAPRPSTGQLAWPYFWYGAVLQSTSTNPAQHLFDSGYAGTHIARISFIGNNRQNGVGFYGHRGDGVATTQGDYFVEHCLAAFNGSDGIRYVNPDGQMIVATDAFSNKGYGIALVSTYKDYQDGFSSFPTSNGNVGGYTTVMNGRTRWNTKGGYLAWQQIGGLFIGCESVSDSTASFILQGLSTTAVDAERGRAINLQTTINSDFEFVLPPASNPTLRTSNVYLRDAAAVTFMGNYWGSVHTQGTYVADSAGTTVIKDSGIIQRLSNYYAGGWVIENTTRASGEVAVSLSNNDGGSTRLTLASPIVGQTTGDTFKLKYHPKRGLTADSLWSGLFMSNSMAADAADSSFVIRHFGYPLFIGPMPNFNPKTDIYRDDGSATARWAAIRFGKLETDGVFQLWTNGKAILESNQTVGGGDSTVIRALRTGYGVRVEGDYADINVLAGKFRWHRLVTDNNDESFRIGYDADTTTAVINRTYWEFVRASGQPNRLTFQPGSTTQSLGIAGPVEFTGNSLTARYFELLGQNSIPTTNPVLNNRLRFSVKQDKAWTFDDNGDSLNITPYNGTTSTTWQPATMADGATADTTVSVTNAAVGDAVAVGYAGITSGKWFISANIESAGTARVVIMNKTGGNARPAAAPIKIRVWK